MPKQINFVINGKGGVGKSFFATNFIQHLKDRSIPHHAFDTDHENSTLTRFQPETTFIDITQEREIDRIFTAAEKCDLLVVDCRAASTNLYLDYFASIGLSEVLRHIGARLTIISPVNHEADSLEQLRVLSDELKDACRWIVVKNECHSTNFQLYDRSSIRMRILEELHGKEIGMPRLQDWLVATLNEHNLTVASAAKHPAITLMDRQRLKQWQSTVYAQFDSVSELLLPQA